MPSQIPNSLRDCVALQTFSAQSAGIVGTIPNFFGRDGPFPGLIFLALSNNYLEGVLPASLSKSSIENLLVNGQNSNNKLNGTLAVIQNMASLKQIWANGNSFTGPIPDLSHLDQLSDVNLRDNQLTGVVPPSLVNLPRLQVVNLTNNYLQGSPPKFRDGIGVDNNMDGSRNQFCTNVSGQPCSSLVNVLLSVIEPLGYPLKFAESWQGNDPCANKWLGIVCSGGNISIINFQSMGITGTISPTFASISSLTKLLLANNSLIGTIPNQLTSMPLLQELDVSNNHLYGRVPSFHNGVVLKFGGNPDIGKDKPSNASSYGFEGSGSNNNVVGITIVILVGAVILIGVGVLLYIKFWKRSGNNSRKSLSHDSIMVDHKYQLDDNILNVSVIGGGEGGGALSPTGNMVISIQVLRQVTHNFREENIIGKGGFGTVYKGELHDGTQIAVKRMQSGITDEKGPNEFTSEIMVLTKVRHKHLVALLGYCLDRNERLLVYEYMPQGALSKHLFNWKEEGIKPLEWKTRLSIALDVARGVEYLHGLTQQIFIHRDLKPSNILLGDDLRAKVSDFGLVRLAPEGKASFQTRLAGTFGYMAPEYAATGRLTTKADVYSFGVILMEIVTGRKALDESQPEENIHLVTWFRRMLLNKDSFRTIIDKTIEVDEETYESINTVAELAGHCSAREPYQRPDMSHAVNVLSSLVEVWKPIEQDVDDVYGINFDMTLPEALQRWQAFEGKSTFNLTRSPSSLHTSGGNTHSRTSPNVSSSHT
ncbi:receptor protein kinase TMK1-like isoform X2 [Vicia villosa]|uniref:receptor protein kinase TMK1-like isoform X2 n=1 Tax=Vicia villosa TaxID=3911 RepID=UPI00273C01A1|nr:receptor protein kinase TMK1-like isoform X2 [Vicia villosa]